MAGRPISTTCRPTPRSDTRSSLGSGSSSLRARRFEAIRQRIEGLPAGPVSLVPPQLYHAKHRTRGPMPAALLGRPAQALAAHAGANWGNRPWSPSAERRGQCRSVLAEDRAGWSRRASWLPANGSIAHRIAQEARTLFPHLAAQRSSTRLMTARDEAPACLHR